MRCISEVDLSAYADGEISAEEKSKIEEHLLECAECRTRLARLKRTSEFLKTAIADAAQEADGLPPATSRILANISGISRGQLVWRRILTKPLAAAAAILIIISVFLVGLIIGRHFLLREKPGEPARAEKVEAVLPTPSQPAIPLEPLSKPRVLYAGIIDAARYDEKAKMLLILEFDLPPDFFTPEEEPPERKGETLIFTGLGKDRPFATLDEIMKILELEESGKEG